MNYPKVNTHYALRQVGSDLFYLMDSISGDYFELENSQFQGLRLADGSMSTDHIAKELDIAPDEVAEFFNEQHSDGVVTLSAKKTAVETVHYRKCDAPHLSDVLVEITGECNLKCRHCFNDRFNTPEEIAKEMSPKQLLKLISELDDLNTRRIQLSGGEALLRPDLWEVMDALEKHKIFLDVISTNALLVDKELAARFGKRFNKNGALYISMDGITADTYEALRGENTFDNVNHSLDMLSQEGCRMFINTMAFKQNLQQLEEMYDWVVDRPSIMGWRIGLPKVLGRYMEHHNHLEVEFDEVIKTFRRILKRWLKERPNFRLELSDFFRTDCLDIGFDTHLPTDNPCKYAMTNASIKPDGTVVFCASLEVHEPAILGNALTDGLPSVWYGQRHMDFRQLTIGDIPKCLDCRYSKLCGGGCRSNAILSYGSLTDVDPRACSAMQLLEDEILELLPQETKESILHLMDTSKPFQIPTGFKKFI